VIRPRTLVLAAVAAVVLLGSTLGVARLTRFSHFPKKPAPTKLARCTLPPAPGQVPVPKSAAAPKVPCWGCSPGSDGWAVRFQTDLDLLAPLGNGPSNAALWLKDFASEVGARADEAEAAMKRRVTVPGEIGKALPVDDPLLLEAEPWADQATMRFYPDVFPMDGFATRIPNLLVSLAFAKSWVARAEAHPESPAALEDCRRAIRWGRLLRQDDVTIIQDLIGLACIRVGAQGLYELAARRGDQPLMLASAVVLGEHAPQRLRTAQVLTGVNVIGDRGVEITDRKLDDVLGVARSAHDRRFRFEAITQLALVRAMGSRAQKEKTEKALDELTASADPLLGASARWARTTLLDDRELKELGVTD
jgi:hypothetical protein